MEFSHHHHNLILICSFFVVFCVVVSEASHLKKHFYKKECPYVEEISRSITWQHTSSNPQLPAKLLRLHFHDCFVRGCDGSILLDSTTTNKAEKAAFPNLSLAGFEVIDEIKAAIEAECPGVVSCADIVALAARDSVSYQFKKKMWSVPMGRRDGSISQATEALSNLPSPSSNFSTLVQRFASKGLGVHDLVILSGGHTIGMGHCNLFSKRLYNFTGKGDQDPSLSPSYADVLRTKCKNLNDTSAVEMDPGSSQDFDTDYFVILKQKMGLFQSDAALLTDFHARKIVDKMVDQDFFFKSFAKSMEKMGAIQVLTGNSGEVRKNCRVPNS
nr:Peroxidase 3 [Ipomoea batatas]